MQEAREGKQNLKDFKIMVRIPELKKEGQVIFKQRDFWQNNYFMVLIGEKLLPFSADRLKYISSTLDAKGSSILST